MRSLASILNVPENPCVEKVRVALSGIVGTLEQMEMQRKKPTPIERRMAEWKAAEKLVQIVREFDNAKLS